MTQDELKQAVAIAALDCIEEKNIVGIGSGTTIHYFIEKLATIKSSIEGAIPSSKETEKMLKKHQIPVLELNDVSGIDIYIDSADAFTSNLNLIKGGGGALTREKILATASKQFICIVDESKKVDILGEFPVAIEVLPMARSFVAREIVKLGGNPAYRANFITDNGNIILDVHHWMINEPLKLERELNNIPGILCNGIFAERSADIILMSTQTGMKVFGANHFLINKLFNS